MGPETRRTGRFLLLGALLITLTSTGLIELTELPGLGGSTATGATDLISILVLLESGALMMYLLYMVGDVERVLSRDYFGELARRQLDYETRLRRLTDLTRLEAFEEAERAARRSSMELRMDPLRRGMERLRRELERLEQAGETGSRFTRHAAERKVAEAELRELAAGIEALERDADETVTTPPPELAISGEYARALERLDPLRELLSSSPFLRVSRRLRLHLEVLLPPLAAVGAVLMWWAG